jgi:hypothetical protein
VPDRHPYAITMWDFSWLERRWPGAGYEDWSKALGELAERGYNAVRIDAFPHLMAQDPDKLWDLVPLWTQMSWGAQSPISVRVGEPLVEFIAEAKKHGIKVALSTWYRVDTTNAQLRIRTPRDQADIWIATLDYIAKAGLIDQILYVDLCNEFPLKIWSSYLYGRVDTLEIPRSSERLKTWMRDSIAFCKERYPDIPYTYSFSSQLHEWQDQDVSMLDFMENHVWMVNQCEFNQIVGYNHDKTSPESFDNLVLNGKREFMSRPDYYYDQLYKHIDNMADWSRASGKGLVTTECWSLIDYKDWPGLDWDYVNEMNRNAVHHAAKTGRWIGMATSNFCGPQFVGAWQDVKWHQELTNLIRSAPIDEGLATQM